MNPLLAKIFIWCIVFELLVLTTGNPLKESYYHVYHINNENQRPNPNALSQGDMKHAANALEKLDDLIDYLKSITENPKSDDYDDLVAIPITKSY